MEGVSRHRFFSATWALGVVFLVAAAWALVVALEVVLVLVLVLDGAVAAALAAVFLTGDVGWAFLVAGLELGAVTALALALGCGFSVTISAFYSAGRGLSKPKPCFPGKELLGLFFLGHERL